ncbi:MAG: DUF4178 domain-containing protein [Deltaproteobacteria bacterium]|nr:DUF4178 domain-containing protein [Deltaproteobacteria bacterium]
MSGEIICPACGAPLDADSRFQDYINCVYCGTQSYVGASTKAISSDSGADATATLADSYTRFRIGQRGYIRWNNDVHEFIVVGRAVYEYDGGYWSEWYIDIGGQGYWLQEDEGIYILYVEIPLENWDVVMMLHIQNEQESEELRAGRVIPALNGEMDGWYLLEWGNAVLSGMEGSMPFQKTDGTTITYMDGVGEKIRYSLEIESDGQDGTLCKGWPLEYEWIRTDDEPEPKGTVGAI